MTNDFDALPLLAGRRLFHSTTATGAGVCADGVSWYLLEEGADVVQVLDSDGGVVDRLPVPPLPPGRVRRLAVDAAGRRVAVAGQDHVAVAGADGAPQRVDHHAWNGFVGGDVAFDPSPESSDLLWMATPSATVTGYVRQPPAGVVSLVDLGTGAVVDTVDLEDRSPEGYEMLVMPGRGVVLDGAYGQDGSLTWFLRSNGRRIEHRSPDFTGTASDIDAPSGGILLMPHTQYVAEVGTWWDGEVTSVLSDVPVTYKEDEHEGDEVYEDADSFGYRGALLHEGLVVALTREGRAIAIDTSVCQPHACLVVDGETPEGYSVRSVGRDRLLFTGGSVTLVAIDAGPGAPPAAGAPDSAQGLIGR